MSGGASGRTPADAILAVSPEQYEAIKQMFSHYDRDHNEKIDASEYVARHRQRRGFGALARDLGEEMTRAERERAIKILDINGDGTIDFAEFLKYWTDMEE